MKPASVTFRFNTGYCTVTIDNKVAKRLLICLLNDCKGLNIDRNYYLYKRNHPSPNSKFKSKP